jgi:hypothetical protein
VGECFDLLEKLGVKNLEKPPKVGLLKRCLPRHPTRCRPSFLELHDIL